VDVVKESVSEMFFGHTSVGTTAVKIVPQKFPVQKGVLLRAPGAGDPVANTRPIWIGGVGVTADSSATGGVPLCPGESMLVPLEDPTRLQAISTDANQDLAWMVV
jgi:hypothetical protein